MAAKKQTNMRIAEPLLRAVAEAARKRGETVTAVTEKAFEAYVRESAGLPPAPPPDVVEAAIVPLEGESKRARKRRAAEPPASPAATRESRTAPAGRQESPEPRTERKRKVAAKPTPAHAPVVPVFRVAGRDAEFPPLLAPEIPDEPDEDEPAPCPHPSDRIDDKNVCHECGQEVD
jgi:hypothetical protein